MTRASEPDELEKVIAEASRRLAEAAGPVPAGKAPLDDGVLYCANHPNVQTLLRCNRCGKPICTRCAVQTPVGYRCRQCVSKQRAVYFTGGASDYLVGGVIAAILGGLACLVISLLRGAWFFGLILGPTVGVGIAEVVRWAVRRRRSQRLWLAVGAGILLGSLPAVVVFASHFSLLSLLTMGLFLSLAVGAATARLR